jgi:hypothetical protein
MLTNRRVAALVDGPADIAAETIEQRWPSLLDLLDRPRRRS